MKWLATPAFMFFSWGIAFTQSPIQFNHYTVEQGLSDNKINDIARDNNNFTWIATLDPRYAGTIKKLVGWLPKINAAPLIADSIILRRRLQNRANAPGFSN